jgi:hypothetical protein
MTYILMIWTVVGLGGAGTQYSRDYKIERDWRPLGVYETSAASTGLQLCEAAAKQLGIKYEMYRCVRSK